MYRNFIFDIDGTIADSETLVVSSLMKAYEEVTRKKLSKEIINMIPVRTTSEILKLLGLSSVETKKLNELWDKYYEEDPVGHPIYDGIRKVLKCLKEQDCNLAVVTSRNKVEADEILMSLEIKDYFKIVISSDDTEKHKPDKEPMEAAITGLDLTKCETIYIGDTINDLLASHAAGIDFALALWGTKDKSLNADVLLKEPLDLLQYIKR